MVGHQFIIDSSLIDQGIKVHMFNYVIENFNNNPKSYDFKDTVILPETAKIEEEYTLEGIKEDPIVAVFRKFYWEHLRIDPTKIRPSGEALIRRILQGKKLPKINYFVDGYNWASAVSKIPIGAYDSESFDGNVTLRNAVAGEEFLAIGGKTRKFKGNELITIADDGTILSQFPYRDADKTKVTKETKNVYVTILGVDGISKQELGSANATVVDFLRKAIISDSENENFVVGRSNYVSNF